MTALLTEPIVPMQIVPPVSLVKFIPSAPAVDEMKEAKGRLLDTRTAVRRAADKGKALAERAKVAQAGLAAATAIVTATRAEVRVAANDVADIRAEAAELGRNDKRALAARARANAANDNVSVAKLRERAAVEILAAQKDVTRVKSARVATAKQAVATAERRADHADALATVAELKEALARAKG